MKKGQEYIGVVDEITFPNKGIIHYEEERDGDKVIVPVIVKGTLPGQKVRFLVNKKRSGKCEGRLLEVIEKTVLGSRTAPCPHFGVCGGCTYQNLSYDNQLALKRDMVKKIIDGVISEPYEFQGIIGSPDEFGYRNKMEFSFGDECKGGDLALGLHKKGSFYDIVTVDNCKIVNQDYNMILTTVLAYFKERNIKFQFINLDEKEMSKKEFESVLRQVGIDSMIDPKSKDKELLTMFNYLSNKEDKVYLNQHILKTPIVRNGKLATVGYEPNVWKTWD